MNEHVNYDQIASTYHQRYQVNPMPGVTEALQTLVKERQPARVFEAGCGTGYWLTLLKEPVRWVGGLDYSRGMLLQAASREPQMPIIQAKATDLPLANATLDLLFCVDAIHHFGDPREYIRQAVKKLRTGGVLAVFGMDPRRSPDDYMYKYFEGTFETDLKRFPAWEQIADWMRDEGLVKVENRVVESFQRKLVGKKILDDHFIIKSSSSQLALLTDETYQAGLERIKAEIAAGEQAGKKAEFVTELSIGMVCGIKN